MNTLEKCIATVEARCEYSLGGVQQFYMEARTGRTFGSLMDAVTAQDVNVLAVGEITNAEMARRTLDAATGCLTLATLRAEDACAGLYRLHDWGLPLHQLAAGVRGILAQQLIRTICTNCKETYEVTQNDLRRFGFKVTDPNAPITLARGMGCEQCKNMGYTGRVGVFQWFEMTDSLRTFLATRPTPDALRQEAYVVGMRPLLLDGLVKVLELQTTPQEILDLPSFGWQ